MHDVDTLIVGGGLSGLSLASLLQQQNVNYLLVEARDRPGGRILSHAAGSSGFDLGPAWFWPHQPRMARLADALGLTVFAQYSRGRLVLEEADGSVRRDLDFATMADSLRIDGGLGRLTQALYASIPADRIRLGTAVRALALMDGKVVARLAGADGAETEVAARSAALCLPPRLVAATIRFTPDLEAATLQAMAAVPTWMAGQAKAVALYDKPFWREQGLSGDGISRLGPMVEIHDLSPAEGGPYALFGFVGVPAHIREGREADLKEAVRRQLERMFGADAGAPREIALKDWAFDPFTATAADHLPPSHHPAYGMPAALDDLWAGRLVFAGSEVAATHGGYAEGALEAAEAAAARIAARTEAYSL